MAQPDGGFQIVNEAAVEHGWCKQTEWPHPLEDCFTKEGKRLIVKFDITGRVIGGEFMVAGGEPTEVNNRNEALGVLEGH